MRISTVYKFFAVKLFDRRENRLSLGAFFVIIVPRENIMREKL